MKKGLIILLIIVISACSNNNSNKEKEPSNIKSIEENKQIENFDWLLGHWKRLNEKGEKETFESWNKSSNYEYNGIGFTLENTDTISKEKMQLIKSDSSWSLNVIVPGELKPVSFKMINFSENEFTCENKENEFPNTIRYWKEGKGINASVSNSELEIIFEFKNIN